MVLQINEAKTKYMKTVNENQVVESHQLIEQCKFEWVPVFRYLGTSIGQNWKDRIKERVVRGNQTFGT